MPRTPPFPDGHYFEFDLTQPMAEVNGHRYSIARRFDLGSRGEPVPGAEYLLVECCGIRIDDPRFQAWLSRFTAGPRLPETLLKPLCAFTLRGDSTGWIARTPVSPRCLRPAEHAGSKTPDTVLAELIAFDCMTREKHGFPPGNVLLHASSGTVLSDTSPAAVPRRSTAAEQLHSLLADRSDALARSVQALSSADVWKRMCAANDSDPALQSAPPGHVPDSIRLRLTLSHTRRKAPQRAVYSLHALERCIRLSDLFPELPPDPLLLMERAPGGTLRLKNLSGTAWTLSRCRLPIRPGACVYPRTGEWLVIPLPLKHRLIIQIDGFDSVRTFAPAADEHSATAPAPQADQPAPPGDRSPESAADLGQAEPVAPAPQAEDWLQAGDPALLRFEPRMLFCAAARMMQAIESRLRGGDFCWIESCLRIDPDSLQTAILHAPPDPHCTLGYAAPECCEGQPFDAAAHAYAAAVWLYRLLVGGYPLEGRRTRAMLQDSCRSEPEMAAQLYGKDALFVFDPQDDSNSIAGLSEAFDVQTRRWNALPDALRQLFLQTFSTCLHASQDQRPSPAQWADMLEHVSGPAAE